MEKNNKIFAPSSFLLKFVLIYFSAFIWIGFGVTFFWPYDSLYLWGLNGIPLIMIFAFPVTILFSLLTMWIKDEESAGCFVFMLLGLLTGISVLVAVFVVGFFAIISIIQNR